MNALATLRENLATATKIHQLSVDGGSPPETIAYQLGMRDGIELSVKTIEREELS